MAARSGGRGRPRSDSPGASRDEIVSAAAAEFAERGYDGTSLRAVARRAGVDAALVHHYFDGKADLLAAAIGAPVRPDKALDAILAGPRGEIGAGIVRFIATQFADDKGRQQAAALLKSAVTAAPVGLLVRSFVSRELVGRLAAVADPPDPQLRAAPTASQIVGLLMCRYVLELEPLARASVEDLVDRVGPVIQQHLFG
jgi:AcrR family transcriptional regulator